jgi:glycosyltransferase involved in cell wall biosynthesis
MLYSVIVPVYNRPDEIDELLGSLTNQTFKDFEVIVVEDGSSLTCENIVKGYEESLNIRYFYKENSGQGFSRNYGFERANGDYFVVFDSDCIIPPHYFETVNEFLSNTPVDCWGGPDRAHPSFTMLQKAISYSMTSPFTTGGIRGKGEQLATFHPRSFNMGISRNVFEKTGGFRITRMGEDIEFSLRIIEHGFSTALIREAYVYHKRRTSLRQFYRQLFFFGRARINIGRYYPGEIKAIHLMPLVFLTGLVLAAAGAFTSVMLLSQLWKLYLGYAFLLFIHAIIHEKNPAIALLAIITSFTQLIAYGAGFITEWMCEKGVIR